MPPTSRPTRAVWDTVAAPHRLNLGLHAMEANEPWLVIDDDYVQDLAEKHRLLRDERGQVFVELESSRAAQAEARKRVIETLLTHYADEFELNGNRFFDGMKAGLVFKRGNWSLMDDPALFQPSGKMQTRERSDLDASNAGEKIWLRVEHQTLQRLPATGAILFGIRIHRTRLDAVAEMPDAARTLLASIDTMDADMQLYKSLALVRGAATAYLRDALV